MKKLLAKVVLSNYNIYVNNKKKINIKETQNIMATQITLSENAKVALSILKGSDKALTLAEISEKAGFKVQPGTMTGLIKNGLVEKGDKVTLEKAGTKEVSSFVFVTDEVGTNDKGEAYNYSDTEKAIIDALKNAGKAMTLAEISEVVGFAVKPGNITSLVNRKGNLAKGDMVEVPTIEKSEVNTYVFVTDELPVRE